MLGRGCLNLHIFKMQQARCFSCGGLVKPQKDGTFEFHCSECRTKLTCSVCGFYKPGVPPFYRHGLESPYCRLCFQKLKVSCESCGQQRPSSSSNTNMKCVFCSWTIGRSFQQVCWRSSEGDVTWWHKSNKKPESPILDMHTGNPITWSRRVKPMTPAKDPPSLQTGLTIDFKQPQPQSFHSGQKMDQRYKRQRWKRKENTFRSWSQEKE